MATDNPPTGMPRVTPYLLYEDVDAAVDYLVTVFGFQERGRMKGPHGRSVHAELSVGDGIVMLGTPGEGYRNPKHLGGRTQLVYVYVDDVNAHCERARAAGAAIVREPADQFYGDRSYGVEDPEGHQWAFTQHVRDISDAEMAEALSANR